jgi:hypothetical protein
MLCDEVCVDVTTDEANCGTCGVVCGGGEVCNATCACPAPFVPTMIEPGSFDQFRVMADNIVAIGPTFDGGINPVLVVFQTTTPLDTDIDLATIPLGEPPVVIAAFDVDLSTLVPGAAFVATAGTLRLTRACETEAQGTLTAATFRGVTGGFGEPELDPDGCTFALAELAFHIMTAPCP